MFAQFFMAFGPVGGWARAARFAAFCGMSLALSVLSGCGASSAKNHSAGQGAAPATADQWLARMSEQYRKAQRYADSGTLRLTFGHGAAGEKIDETVDFSVTFERPNRLRMHCYQAIVVADGRDFRATIAELEGQVLHLPCPQQLAVETLFADPSLAQALTQIAGSPPQITLLMTDKFVEAIGEDAQPPKLLEPRTIDDRTCRGLEFQRADGRLVLWIDAQSFVLRRIEFPTDGLAQYLEQQIGQPIKGATLVADLRGAAIDPPIDAVAFEFEVPAGAKLVSRFDRRQPPIAPSALLGSKIPNFTFTGLDGESVTPSALSGKVVVIDFWATWCQPCLESLPNLQQIYERYKSNDRLAIYAVNIDQKEVTDAQVKQAFAQRKLSIPIARDTEEQAQTVFQLANIPALFILGPDGTVAHSEVGFNPNLASELPAKLDRLLAGQSIHEETLREYESRKAEFEATFGQATADDAQGTDNEQPARAVIAQASEPARHRLVKLWTAAGIDRPGNVLAIEDQSGEKLVVNDGWKRAIVLDSAGNIASRHELRIPELAVISYFRTAVDDSGRRWFAGSANTQRQMHLFDQQWSDALSYPHGDGAEISDVQLADLDGDGQPEICIAYWGDRGIEAIDLAGEVRWSAGGLENVFRLAAVGPSSGAKTLMAAHNRGTIATFDAQGARGAEITVANRFIRNVIAEDLDGDGTPELCGLAPVAQDRDVLVGLSATGEELWSYELPSGLHEQPVEMIIGGRVLDQGAGQWIVAAADGSIQLLSTDGELIDRFHCGAAVTGMSAAQIDGRPALVIATTQGLSAWRLEAR